MYHCHSDYSLLDSCTDAKEYVELCVRDGSKALSISEHGKISNWTEKWAACKRSGIKYIHSVEIYMTESLQEKVRDNYHTILMAKNLDGVKEINDLVSRSFKDDHFYYVNRITFDEFLNLSDNVITTSACLASPLNKLPDEHPMYMKLANKYDFLEIQPHICEEQAEYNKRLFDLSKRINKPLIVGTDTHSSSQYKSECRDILLEAKRKSYSDDKFDLTYKTYDEILEMFKEQNALPEEEYVKALNNTNLLDELTEEIELDTSIKYPILYGTREKDAEMFEQTIKEKFDSKVEEGIIPPEQAEAFESAIKEEVRVFKKLHMEGFMLSMSELISWCKSQNMAIGIARGSVGGSRVAYITDIIDLNPETWHTVFSRFCNEDREEIGDIDIDCVESDRPAIFEHIIQRFGADKTARVASFGTLADKSVIDEVGRALMYRWNQNRGYKFNEKVKENPYNYDIIAQIKSEYSQSPEETKNKYPDIFYYFDGLVGTKVSQSVHPAGMVISPITLNDNFGIFNKDGEICLMLDMDNVHDYTGLAKYDFLILKTVQVIRDTCNYLNQPYPKSHEIDWNDKNVWADMIRSPSGIFQFESKFSFDCLRKFKPQNIFDMSIVTACIRPSGTSYRDDLLARKVHSNPSDIIDELLKDNLGYLIYQEDTIKFLQQICGLSGSASDNIRRAIGRKQKDRLDSALPSILDGYCSKSPKPREEAEKEAKEFLQIIEDSSNYQFGYNHSIAYCMLGYLCAYYRYYHPLEFLTAFLNNAANEDDIKNGTEYATKSGIKVTMPKWGVSKEEYFFNTEKNTIAKGLGSIKYMGSSAGKQLYELSKDNQYDYFFDLLDDIANKTKIDQKQLDILIKIDFFSDFGNQRELLKMFELFYGIFNKGQVRKISKVKVEGSRLESVIKKYSISTTKSGGEAKSYTVLDIKSLLRETENQIKDLHVEDLSTYLKMANFVDIMGYPGYSSGKESDRRKLYIVDIYPMRRHKDNKLFGYSVKTHSIGSGKDSLFTLPNYIYKHSPIEKGETIQCTSWEKRNQYYWLLGYNKIYC